MILLIALSAIAVIVKEGLTPGFAEIIEPSIISKLSYPKTKLFLSITPSFIFLPITAPPRICAVDGIPASGSKAKTVAFPFMILAYFFANSEALGIYVPGFFPSDIRDEKTPRIFFH